MPHVILDKKKIAIIIGILILIAAGIPSFLLFKQNEALRKKVSDPQASSKEDTASTLAKVGKLILLPQNEEPTVATITDKEKLKDQPLFANAKNGDKLIVYTKARKAIIYDPDRNIIVDLAPVNIAAPTPTAGAPQPKIKVAILNGTSITGLTKKVEGDLMPKVQNIEVVIKNNAVNEYEKTQVVNLTAIPMESAEKIAQAVNGEINSLPANEPKPIVPSSKDQVDILIIAGKNYVN